MGYVIGRKAMPRAVDRNRLRRRLRESMRAARPAIEQFDIIVRVRRPVPREAIGEAVRASSEMIGRLLGGDVPVAGGHSK